QLAEERRGLDGLVVREPVGGQPAQHLVAAQQHPRPRVTERACFDLGGRRDGWGHPSSSTAPMSSARSRSASSRRFLEKMPRNRLPYIRNSTPMPAMPPASAAAIMLPVPASRYAFIPATLLPAGVPQGAPQRKPGRDR